MTGCFGCFSVTLRAGRFSGNRSYSSENDSFQLFSDRSLPGCCGMEFRFQHAKRFGHIFFITRQLLMNSSSSNTNSLFLESEVQLLCEEVVKFGVAGRVRHL